MNKTPLIKYSTQTLSHASSTLLPEVGIHRQRLAGQKVHVTQFAEIGVSFIFSDDKEPAREFHVPARMVSEIFL